MALNIHNIRQFIQSRFGCIGRTVLHITIFLLILIAIAVALGEFLYPWHKEKAQLKRVKIGMSEKQVVEILGEPTWKFTEKDGENYYIPGHSFKKRKITNKVYLYGKADMILYVWYDKKGFVEDIFLARS